MRCTRPPAINPLHVLSRTLGVCGEFQDLWRWRSNTRHTGTGDGGHTIPSRSTLQEGTSYGCGTMRYKLPESEVMYSSPLASRPNELSPPLTESDGQSRCSVAAPPE